MVSKYLLLFYLSLGVVQALTTCSVLNYGAKADNSTDIGPAILSAYNNCVKGHTTSNPADTVLLVPSGNYLMKSTVTISSSSYFTLEIDGYITVAFITSLAGTMFNFQSCNYVTLKGSGTVNGQGSLWRPGSSLTTYPSRPRLFRFENCNNCDISGVYLVNSPMFHMTVIGNNNYIHDQKITADHIGETDGYDVSGNNNYVYNVNVENGDECVTVKSPTNGFLAKQITCYYTAGCNIGSFGAGGAAAVNNVTYTGVSLSYSDSGFMIKSYPDATGYVTNVLYEDSTMNQVAYPLDIDMYWEGASNTPASIYASGITYSGITGTGDTNTKRPLIKLNCLPGHTCTNIVYQNVQLTSSVSKTNQISNACGSGLSGLPACSGSSSGTTVHTTTTSHTTTTAGGSGSCVALYGQCGGIGYTGSTTCCSGATCTYSNAYYSQCLAS